MRSTGQAGPAPAKSLASADCCLQAPARAATAPAMRGAPGGPREGAPSKPVQSALRTTREPASKFRLSCAHHAICAPCHQSRRLVLHMPCGMVSLLSELSMLPKLSCWVSLLLALGHCMSRSRMPRAKSDCRPLLQCCPCCAGKGRSCGSCPAATASTWCAACSAAFPDLLFLALINALPALYWYW